MANTFDIAQEFYPETIDEIRDREYPTLRDITYLDHAGTTLYAKSLIERYSQDLTTNLFGNPHSASASSQLTSNRVEDIRLKALRFFNADPDVYDLVFVPNATAGIKLVAESLRDYRGSPGFWYGYHVDSHTSLVGVQALADLGNRCFKTDGEVRQWIDGIDSQDESPKLFAYPAQSNMNGRRFPLKWCNQIRNAGARNTFTLLDAASLVSTSPLDLSDPQICPDFVVLSFYKIFGFPDLGALIVRKESGHIFNHRRYFGGGTVEMVTVGNNWYARKQSSVHDQLEDGTLPFHNIIALESAFQVHGLLYGSMANISSHTAFLARQLFNRLSSIKHANGKYVCHLYLSPGCSYEDRSTQGPIIAMNLLDSNGNWIGKSEIEKLASVKSIHIRSGTLCNPGGTASLLGLSNDEIEANYRAGQRCGDENDIMQGKPTGALRLSLGAMTSSKDIDRFVSFIMEFYVEQSLPPLSDVQVLRTAELNRFYVESLCVYPIKSCSGFAVPPGIAWKVRPEGLAWDREWCIVHQGTGVALSQKRYPRMALIKPLLDFEKGILRVAGESPTGRGQLDVPLSRDDPHLVTTEMMRGCQNSGTVRKPSLVCGDRVIIQVYSSTEVSDFFSELLGVPCTLARFPPRSHARHSKNPYRHHHPNLSKRRNEMPGSFPVETNHTNNNSNHARRKASGTSNPILLSNESPILLISRSSVNRLNEQIKNSAATTINSSSNNTKTVAANVFRANIVIAENLPHSHSQYSSVPIPSSTSSLFEQPYIEDKWSSITIGPKSLRFDVLGACQRCQMVCIDQMTAEKREEPLSTLAKSRRVGGKVIFGRHLGLSQVDDIGLDIDDDDESEEPERTIMVGDLVMPSYSE
ncbi:molybdenum cofactor sulfurase protein (HxB), putative [Talaromyces stipitatus ATCC 10500]|uniref:Molybdenum cofactor sulfurase n=1 Tax=Talaromyces stipitatus (strain ATCC 10500 / CBS 375.48 / QM 6759 / NRRL 1006) TaxID=441959 RepID=B8ME64_TALSN|nr:molybdenum cofactor sulfurase protein (HxB), putative [Talaromyces stipitatus ATCC 10500]EED16491.1 molybdenum cofactor sulfurase protein (HxB), putative [Talaromyces stipitatus ATCC 10500]